MIIFNNYKISVLFLSMMLAATMNNSFAIEGVIQKEDKTYVKIGVDGMACPFCAYGLEKAIKHLDGVDDFSVNLNEGFLTFSVPSDKKPSEKELEKLVKEAGFKIREIEYSFSSFITKKEEKRD